MVMVVIGLWLWGGVVVVVSLRAWCIHGCRRMSPYVAAVDRLFQYGGQVRRPDDYDVKKVADLGPSEPSQTLNSLVLSQLKRPPPPPPAPVLPPAPVKPLGPTPSGEVEDGEVGVAAPVVTRVLKLEHMVSHVTSFND